MALSSRLSKHYVILPLVLLLVVLNYVFNIENSNYWTINYIIVFSYLILLYIAVTRHRMNYFYHSINSGNENGISLTFDDGPNTEFTEKALSILEKYNVKATFFIIGKNIKENEALLKKIFDKGHIIANHSFNHTYWFNSLPSKMIAKEIAKNNDTIYSVIKEKPNYYRTPFGLCSPNVARGIKKANMVSIGWNFRSFDTMAKDEKKLLKKMKKHTKDNSIFLLHDNNSFTLNVLDDFLSFCKTNGTEIVSLDKMIGIKAYKKLIL